MKLSCRDRSDQVRFMKKISQDNDVTNRIGVVYVKNKIGLSSQIGSGADCDKNQSG